VESAVSDCLVAVGDVCLVFVQQNVLLPFRSHFVINQSSLGYRLFIIPINIKNCSFIRNVKDAAEKPQKSLKGDSTHHHHQLDAVNLCQIFRLVELWL